MLSRLSLCLCPSEKNHVYASVNYPTLKVVLCWVGTQCEYLLMFILGSLHIDSSLSQMAMMFIAIVAQA